MSNLTVQPHTSAASGVNSLLRLHLHFATCSWCTRLCFKPAVDGVFTTRGLCHANPAAHAQLMASLSISPCSSFQAAINKMTLALPGMGKNHIGPTQVPACLRQFQAAKTKYGYTQRMICLSAGKSPIVTRTNVQFASHGAQLDLALHRYGCTSNCQGTFFYFKRSSFHVCATWLTDVIVIISRSSNRLMHIRPGNTCSYVAVLWCVLSCSSHDSMETNLLN